MIEPTQTDRDAASEYFAILDAEFTTRRPINARLGAMDDLPIVQAIARARIEGAERMREAAVALADSMEVETNVGHSFEYTGDVGSAILALSPADVVKERT